MWQRDIMLPVVPMFHVNAWGTPHAAAMVGCTLVLPGPGLDGASLVNLIDTYKVSGFRCSDDLARADCGCPAKWFKTGKPETECGRWFCLSTGYAENI